jgi:predicted site-specific integrase-resolvase
MPIDTPPTFLHTVEVADRWKISPRTLERWRWLGIGPAYVRVGGRVIYRLDVIEAYERSCEIGAVR